MTKFYTDKQQIINWLEKHEVKNYTLVPDEQYGFVVDVYGDVNLRDKKLLNIPVKFNKISGSFYCDNNKLNSLEFCPQIIGDNFYCYSNQLTSLEFCPQTVGRSFNCSENKITSLEFCPETIGGNFWCGSNQLLKEIQEITDFKLIYLEHQKIIIAKFSDKLESDLYSDKNKKSTKIKI